MASREHARYRVVAGIFIQIDEMIFNLYIFSRDRTSFITIITPAIINRNRCR